MTVGRFTCAGVLIAGVLLLIPGFVAESRAAGAFAIGKCAAYGQAFDYASEEAARAAAQKQCSGSCTTIVMKHACAAMAVDLTNPCGPFGYAVRPLITGTLNAASRECYKNGGKECVIRAWACDERG